MSKKIKILYFIQLPPPVHGVACVNDFIYHNELINENIDKSLLEIKFSNDITELRRTTPWKINQFFKLLRQLKMTIREILPDYVYFSIMPVGKGFWRDLFFVRVIRRHQVKMIFHLHNRGIEQRSGNFIFLKLYRYVFQDSIIIHLSEKLMQKEILGLNLANTRTAVIPNGVEEVQYRYQEKQGSKVKLLFVSNLFPAKGIFDLLEILNIIKEQLADVQLQIVGQFMRTKYREQFNRKMGVLGLDESVTLAGPKYAEEKLKAYREADIFLFPTRFKQECSPLVILEAMQFGLPIIASGIGAIPEIIDQNENGILLDPGDHQGFARSVLELLGQKRRINDLGQAAMNKFLANYTTAHLEARLKDMYDNHLTDIR